MNRVVLLLVDGLRPDLAESMLAAGELPALQAMLAAGSRHAPSRRFPRPPASPTCHSSPGAHPVNATSPRFAGSTAVVTRVAGGRIGKRSAATAAYQAPRLDQDIAPGVRSIFELVPESLGIFTPVAKGLTEERDPSRGERKFWGAVAHYVLWHQPSDDAVSRHLLRGIDRGWRFIFAQFPAVDGYSHQDDSDERQGPPLTSPGGSDRRPGARTTPRPRRVGRHAHSPGE